MGDSIEIYRGGRVYEPGHTGAVVRDVVVQNGIFSTPENIVSSKARTIDLKGCLLTPGLVDLHTHVFDGQDLGVATDSFALQSGTTTVVDAGSAGGHLIGAFRRAISDSDTVRVVAFLNISSIGATSIALAGELQSAYADPGVAVDAIEANRDIVVGVKVRASHNVGGDFTSRALTLAREVADRVALPLMVHLGPPPARVDEIMDLLRPGDVLTHAFSGWAGNTLISEGRVRASVRDALARGVLLDVGHGASGFSFEVARHMLDRGIAPDTISSDLHAYSRHEVVSLPIVMSKLLAIGLPLDDVLRGVTATPAAAVRIAAGTLDVGSRADMSGFILREGEFDFTDGFGGGTRGEWLLEPLITISGGELVFDARTP